VEHSKATHLQRRAETPCSRFIAKHQDHVSGALSGFDRLVFRGTLRSIAHAAGMNQYLCSNDILLKNFGSHVEQVSKRLKTASLAEAGAARRPVRYLASSALNKEDIARRISAEDRITTGLVCVLTCVELCRTFEITATATPSICSSNRVFASACSCTTTRFTRFSAS
jgi:hypothetical protein